MRLNRFAESPHVVRHRLFAPEADAMELVCDSREAGPGRAFFALRGEHADGHAFLEQAVAAGASALVVSDPEAFDRWASTDGVEGLRGVMQVPPGRAALADLAATFYGDPSREVEVVAVTGTNGKTTVSHLVAQLSGALGQPCGVMGSLGTFVAGRSAAGERTTPEAPVVQSFLRQCAAASLPRAAMEATSIGISLERTRNVRLAAAAFTNLSRDHLEFHGTMEAYQEAKTRLFLDYETGAAVVNGEDAGGAGLIARLRRERPGLPLIVFGLAGGEELTVRDAVTDAAGSRGVLTWRGEAAPFATALMGRFNLANLLAAVGLLLHCGEPLQGLAAAAAACRGVAGRFERVEAGFPYTVLVDYAHTPDALEHALRSSRALTAGKVWCIFGCGGNRDPGKRPEMGAVAARWADRVVVTSDNPRDEEPEEIIRAITAAIPGGAAAALGDRRAAIHWVLERAEPGDLVLVAGKGHEPYQEIAGIKHPFDDREVVLEWAGKSESPKG